MAQWLCRICACHEKILVRGQLENFQLRTNGLNPACWIIPSPLAYYLHPSCFCEAHELNDNLIGILIFSYTLEMLRFPGIRILSKQGYLDPECNRGAGHWLRTNLGPLAQGSLPRLRRSRNATPTRNWSSGNPHQASHKLFVNRKQNKNIISTTDTITNNSKFQNLSPLIWLFETYLPSEGFECFHAAHINYDQFW